LPYKRTSLASVCCSRPVCDRAAPLAGITNPRRAMKMPKSAS